MMFDLNGKVAVVTGSTKGIGKSIACSMAALGAKVVISSRKADACEEVTKELTNQGFEKRNQSHVTLVEKKIWKSLFLKPKRSLAK